MEVNSPPETPDIHWIATWGDQVKVGDLVKVPKLGGAVRVISLRRFDHNHPRPVVVSSGDDGHWYYGAVVQDKHGKEFHVFVQPHEPCFIALDTPLHTGHAEGLAPDGDIE